MQLQRSNSKRWRSVAECGISAFFNGNELLPTCCKHIHERNHLLAKLITKSIWETETVRRYVCQIAHPQGTWPHNHDLTPQWITPYLDRVKECVADGIYLYMCSLYTYICVLYIPMYVFSRYAYICVGGRWHCTPTYSILSEDWSEQGRRGGKGRDV